jgi:hypothetical protein
MSDVGIQVEKGFKRYWKVIEPRTVVIAWFDTD